MRVRRRTVVSGLTNQLYPEALEQYGIERSDSQFAIHRYLTDNDADSHVSKLRQIYGERCEAMLQSLARHFPAGVRWTKPEGGMFLWVELPPRLDTAQLLPTAIEAKVAFVPGAPFFANEKPNHFLRLNFSNQTPERIETGIKKLADVIVNKGDQ